MFRCRALHLGTPRCPARWELARWFSRQDMRALRMLRRRPPQTPGGSPRQQRAPSWDPPAGSHLERHSSAAHWAAAPQAWVCLHQATSLALHELSGADLACSWPLPQPPSRSWWCKLQLGVKWCAAACCAAVIRQQRQHGLSLAGCLAGFSAAPAPAPIAPHAAPASTNISSADPQVTSSGLLSSGLGSSFTHQMESKAPEPAPLTHQVCLIFIGTSSSHFLQSQAPCMMYQQVLWRHIGGPCATEMATCASECLSLMCRRTTPRTRGCSLASLEA